MKEKYLRPAVINADTLNGNGVLPILEAITAGATAGYALGRSLKKMFGMSNGGKKFLPLTKGRDSEDDFCMA